MSEELKKQAQLLLAEARRLIDEAGKLAKEGQFGLYFGEIGRFVPKSAWDRESYRAAALKSAMEDGKYVDHKGPPKYEPIYKPWAELTEDEQGALVEGYIDDWVADAIPSELHEYGDVSYGDRWWHPSRC